MTQRKKPKRNNNPILVIDNDALVNIVDKLAISNAAHTNQVLNYLLLKYPRCWIPKNVIQEFTFNNKGRTRTIDALFSNYKSIRECPIPVHESEITALINSTNRDRGEGEAILQITKAKKLSQLNFSEIKFLTRDSKAQALANRNKVEIYSYQELCSSMSEIGIELP